MKATALTEKPKGITLRGNVYWLRFREAGELKQLSLQTSDYAMAVERAIKSRGAPELAPKPRTDLAGEIEDYIDHKKLIKMARKGFKSVATEKHARRSLAGLLSAFPHKNGKGITNKDIAAYIQTLSKTRREAGVMSDMRAVRAFFSWLVEQKVRFDNPCKGLVILPSDAARTLAATKEQRNAIMADMEDMRTSKVPAVKSQYHEALHFALFCAFYAGMRLNEIVQARADWFHLEGGTPYIEVKNTDSFRTKNRRGRTIPISPSFAAFLKVYGMREPFMMAEHKATQGKAAYRYDLRKPWNNIMTKHGLTWLTPHVARHSFGSILVQEGESVSKVAKWLGHSVSVCERHYIHLTPGDTGISRLE